MGDREAGVWVTGSSTSDPAPLILSTVYTYSLLVYHIK
jgi:hypothetical protein